MPAPLVLVWTDDPAAYRGAIEEAGLAKRVEVAGFKRNEKPGDDVLARAEGMIAWPPPEGTLARMPRLRWLQTLSVGVNDWFDRPDFRDGIALTCARGIHRVQMPENILGALFHLTKHYAQHANSSSEGRWARRVSEPLAGKTLGILGLGTIGQELARKAAALEMRVIGTRQSAAAVAHVEKTYKPQDTDQVLAQSDFVLLLLPHTPETDCIINSASLARMKSTAYLLNFARGQLIVDDDLIEAVRSKAIAGAVLDTFRQEPLPAGHPFWKTEGILVLPHIGGGHPARDRIVAELFVENLRRWLDREPLLQLVDRSKGY
jgi:glyoxylate/hydroxypyruvate reductase